MEPQYNAEPAQNRHISLTPEYRDTEERNIAYDGLAICDRWRNFTATWYQVVLMFWQVARVC